MRRTRSRRRQRRLEQRARWLEELWSCDCEYHNVASFRCYGCGARPRRALCSRLAQSDPR